MWLADQLNFNTGGFIDILKSISSTVLMVLSCLFSAQVRKSCPCDGQLFDVSGDFFIRAVVFDERIELQ